MRTFVTSNYFIGGLTGLISFIVYLLTLAPTVYWGDSGELITVAYTLGIAHPSGYPTWTLLGHLFTYIPFGSVAWRVNLMSAVFGSLAVMLLYFICYKLTKSKSGSFLASIAFGFSVPFWNIATVAEVYTLHIFFIALNLLLLLIWREKQATGEINCNNWLYLFWLCYGLSLTNHITSILLLPGFLYFILVKEQSSWFKFTLDKGVLKPRVVLICAVVFIIGLLPYLYLPIRSAMNPLIDWGNPETLSSFIYHVTGKQYGGYVAEVSTGTVSTALFLFIRTFNVLLGFILVGWFSILKDKRNLLFLAIPIVIQTAFNLTYDITDITYYFLPVWLMLSVVVAYGWEWIVTRFNLKKAWMWVIIVIIVIASFNYYQYDYLNKRGDNTLEFSNYIFQEVKPKSIVFVGAEEHIVLGYFQLVEKKADTVHLISLEMFTMPWYYDYIHNKWPELAFSRQEAYPSDLTPEEKVQVEGGNSSIVKLVLERKYKKDIIENNKGYNFYSTPAIDAVELAKMRVFDKGMYGIERE